MRLGPELPFDDFIGLGGAPVYCPIYVGIPNAQGRDDRRYIRGFPPISIPIGGNSQHCFVSLAPVPVLQVLEDFNDVFIDISPTSTSLVPTIPFIAIVTKYCEELVSSTK